MGRDMAPRISRLHPETGAGMQAQFRISSNKPFLMKGQLPKFPLVETYNCLKENKQPPQSQLPTQASAGKVKKKTARLNKAHAKADEHGSAHDSDQTCKSKILHYPANKPFLTDTATAGAADLDGVCHRP